MTDIAGMLQEVQSTTTGMGLAGIAIIQVGGIVLAHIKGRRRDSGRRSEYSELKLLVQRNQEESRRTLSVVAERFDEHATNDAESFAEIKNTFTEISGTMKLHSRVHEELTAALGEVKDGVAAINTREIARLERQADSSDRRKS